MKIAVAQLRPHVGKISQNVAQHLQLLQLAQESQIDLVVFPELSLTGYEPSHAAALSMKVDDKALTPIQDCCNKLSLSALLGLPLSTAKLPQISAMWLRPFLLPQVYSKQHLHEDEVPFFFTRQDQVAGNYERSVHRDCDLLRDRG